MSKETGIFIWDVIKISILIVSPIAMMLIDRAITGRIDFVPLLSVGVFVFFLAKIVSDYNKDAADKAPRFEAKDRGPKSK